DGLEPQCRRAQALVPRGDPVRGRQFAAATQALRRGTRRRDLTALALSRPRARTSALVKCFREVTPRAPKWGRGRRRLAPARGRRELWQGAGFAQTCTAKL